MQKTIYSCDRCKKNVETNKDLMRIGVGICAYKGYGVNKLEPSVESELCSQCAEHFGLIKKVVKNDEIVVEHKDLKDELWDVVGIVIEELQIPPEEY